MIAKPAGYEKEKGQEQEDWYVLIERDSSSLIESKA